MDIYFNSIINLSPEEIKHCKIELNTHAANNNNLYIDDWLNLSVEEKEAGEIKHSFYLWHDHEEKSSCKFKAGELVFSFFAVDDSKSEWLFVSAAEITDIQTDKKVFKPQYNIAERFRPFFGRLIVNCNRPAPLVYCYKAETIIEKCIVKEVLPSFYVKP